MLSFLVIRIFNGYLHLIQKYGINFTKLAGKRIKVIYTHERDEIAALDNNYVVIGTYNHISAAFDADRSNCFGIITAKTFFNPLKGQLNAHNIKFVGVDEFPELQGFGHGFWGDMEYLHLHLPGQRLSRRTRRLLLLTMCGNWRLSAVWS